MSAPISLQAQESGKPLQVVCTILPVYVLTLNVVGQIPGVKVTLLLPAHQGCPHNYDLTPGDLIRLSLADVIVANGLRMEEFLEKFLDRPNLKTRVILAAQKVEPIPNQPGPAHLRLRGQKTKTDHHHAGTVNGHAWVSPAAASIMVGTIGDGLALKDPVSCPGISC